MAIITTTNAPQHNGRRIVDVLNNVFGCTCGIYRTGYWKPDSPTYVVWFPKISLSQNGRGDTEWLNRFTDSSKNELTVIWNGSANNLAQREAYAATYLQDLQVVFANILGTLGYEFIGVYQYVGKDANGVRHYERIATSIDTALCPPRTVRRKRGAII